MKKRIVILLLIIGFVTGKAQPQDSIQLKKRQHQITLRFGLNYIKDEKLHPQTHIGILTKLSYGFEKRKNDVTRFRATVGYSRLKTTLEDVSKSVNLKLSLQYSYNYFIFQKNRLKYYLGPKPSLAYSTSYFPNWDNSHLYWANYLSIGANNIFTFQRKNKSEWVVSFSIPLLNVYSRPNSLRLYKIDDIDFSGIVKNLNGNRNLGFWSQALPLESEIEYRFPVFKNKTAAITYFFELIRLRKKGENAFTQLSHQIGIQLGL